MLERIFNSTTNTMLTKSMDAAALRNQVIANNIANVDTPKFKRSEVVFEDKLRTALQNEKRKVDLLRVTNPRHMQIHQSQTTIEPEIVTLDNLSYRNDENNVDIDVEMAKKTKNDILYDSMSRCVGDEIKMLRLAITGR